MAVKIFLSGGAVNITGLVNDILAINPTQFDWMLKATKYYVRDNIEGQNYELGIYSNVQNEAGVAYGYFKIPDVDKINAKLVSDLAEGNAIVDDIFYSPFHIKGIIEPFNIDHEDRKPGIGMFQKAKEKFDFDTKGSFMIGDRYSDIGFGNNAGLKTIFVRLINRSKCLIGL